MSDIIKDWLVSLGFISKQAEFISTALLFSFSVFVAWISYLLTTKIVLFYLKKMIEKTKTKWDDILYEHKVFSRLSHIVPALIIYYGVNIFLPHSQGLVNFMHILASLYLVIMGIMVTNALVSGLHSIYNTYSVSKNRPIKGLVQVIQIFVYILGFGMIISILFQKDLTSFFAGLGAMAAVIILIFKDSILGFVAGIQLSANDMVRLGDWLSMPSRNADGTVIDISLNTVKVQNWDQTISTIPPYALISESFTNWRGMKESGGRRIKRHVSIDMNSIRFLGKKDIDQLKRFLLLKDYLSQKETELAESNSINDIGDATVVNGRKLTNIGTYRRYITEYLKHHSQINNDMTFLVRQLQPTDKGLPMEIYVFCRDQRWAYYEEIQADIFDHLIAIIPYFDLSIYQSPSSHDILHFGQKIKIKGD